MSDATDLRSFRECMSHFATGVVVVTGVCDDEPVGLAAQSFVSQSLEPPLVSVSPAKSSKSWRRIRGTGHFGINILTADQLSLCRTFAQSGGRKFDHVRWFASHGGLPRLDGAIAFISCRLFMEHEAGDHLIALGEVLHFDVTETPGTPLLFYRGAYASLGRL